MNFFTSVKSEFLLGLSCLKESWKIIDKNKATFFSLALAYAAIEIFPLIVFGKEMANLSTDLLLSKLLNADIVSFLIVFGVIFYWLIKVVFLVGFIKLIFKAHKGEKIYVATFKFVLTKKSIIRFIKTDLIVFPILVALAFLSWFLLFIPALIWYAFVFFSYFIVIDEDYESKSIFDSILLSIKLSKGYRFAISFILVAYSILALVEYLIHPSFTLLADTAVIPFYYMVLFLLYQRSKSKGAQNAEPALVEENQ